MKAEAMELVRGALDRLRASRALRAALVVLVLDVALGWTFAWVSVSRGLVSPGGVIHADVAVLGAAYVFTRVVVRFGVPALVGGAIASALLDRG